MRLALVAVLFYNMNTRTQIYAHRRYQISRNWQGLVALHCIRMEKTLSTPQ